MALTGRRAKTVSLFSPVRITWQTAAKEGRRGGATQEDGRGRAQAVELVKQNRQSTDSWAIAVTVWGLSEGRVVADVRCGRSLRCPVMLERAYQLFIANHVTCSPSWMMLWGRCHECPPLPPAPARSYPRGFHDLSWRETMWREAGGRAEAAFFSAHRPRPHRPSSLVHQAFQHSTIRLFSSKLLSHSALAKSQNSNKYFSSLWHFQLVWT